MKVRLRFTKHGKVRFTSHRDLARMWERALRRAGLAVAYSQGFSPRPKLHFGLALPTGAESEAEYLDIDLEVGPGGAPTVDIDPASLPARLTPCLPEGIDVEAAVSVDAGVVSLQQAVTSCTWRIGVGGATAQEAAVAVERALAADQLVVTRERKGKAVTDDLRPYILALAVIDPTPHGFEIEAELGTQPRSLRPGELLLALDPPLVERRVRRIHQWMTLDGVRSEPVSLGPAETSSSTRAQVRAS